MSSCKIFSPGQRRGGLRAICYLAAVTCLPWCGRLSAAESVSISPRGSESATSLAESSVPSWSKTGVALAATLGAVIVGLFAARRLMPQLSNPSHPGQVRLLSQTALGTRGVVYVLRCGPRVLVVGATASHMSTLAEIADPDEIVEFERCDRDTPALLPSARTGVREHAPSTDAKGQLHGMLDKIENWNAQG